jgi:hypothetical protein
MGSKFTKTDLLQITDYVEFESFCHNLLATTSNHSGVARTKGATPFTSTGPRGG